MQQGNDGNEYLPKALLVVEDDKVMREGYEKVFPYLGIKKMYFAENHKEGIDFLLQYPEIDCALIDLKIPLGDLSEKDIPGYKEQFKNKFPRNNLKELKDYDLTPIKHPVLYFAKMRGVCAGVISGYSFEELNYHLEGMVTDFYIAKPIKDIQCIKDKFTSCMEKQASSQEISLPLIDDTLQKTL